MVHVSLQQVSNFAEQSSSGTGVHRPVGGAEFEGFLGGGNGLVNIGLKNKEAKVTSVHSYMYWAVSRS